MRIERGTLALVAVAGLAMPAMAQDSVSNSGGLPGDALDPFDTGAQCANYQADLAPRFGSWPGTRFGVVPLMKSSKTSATFYTGQISAQHVSRDSILSNGGVTYNRWHGDINGDTYGVNSGENTAANFPLVTSAPNSIQLAASFGEFDGDHDGGIASIIEYDRSCPNRLLVRRVVGATSQAVSGGAASGNVAMGTIDANGNMYVRSDDFGVGAPVFADDNIYRIRTLSRDCSTVNQIGVTFDVTDHLVIADASVHTTPSNVPQSLAGNPAGTYAGLNFNADFITNDTGAAPSTNQGAGFRPGTSSSRGQPGSSAFTFPAFGGVATFAAITENAADTAKDRVSVWGVAGNGAIAGAFTYPLNGTIITNGCDGTSWNTGAAGSGSGTLSQFGHYASQVAFNGGNGQIAVGRDGTTGDALVAGVIYDDDANAFRDNPINAVVLQRVDATTGAALGDWELVAHVNEGSAGTPGTNTPIHGDFGNDGAAFSGDPGEFDGVLDLNPLSPTYDGPIGELRPLLDVTGGAPLGPSISAPAFDGMGNIYFTSAVALNKWDSDLGAIFIDTDSALLKARYDETCGWRLELMLELGNTQKGRNSTYDYQIQFFGVADSNSVSSGTFWSGNVTSENWGKLTPAYLNDPATGNGVADNRALGGMVLSCDIVYDRDRDGDFDDPTSGGGDPLSLDESYNVALWVGYRPCLADVTTQGAASGTPFFGVPDELVTGADVQYYVNLWVAGDDKADITTQGAADGTVLFDIPDGTVTGADIQRFINAWVGGCDG